MMSATLRVLLLTAGMGLFVGLGLATADAATVPPRPGTVKMAALLREIQARTPAINVPFRNRERAALIAERMTGVPDPKRRLDLRALRAYELLNTGDTAEAIQEFSSIRALIESEPTLANDAFRKRVEIYLGLAHLRMGEQENCLSNHNAKSCFLPFAPEAFHKSPRGSRGAVQVLSDVLSRHPSDLQARWLLNIASMTLGEYPDKTPAAFRIDPVVFASERPFPRWENIAGELGLDQDGLAGGVVAEDFDNDGDLDLMVTEWGPLDQIRLYRNNGDGTFRDHTGESGLTGIVGGLNMVQADYDNDGLVDVLVLRGAWVGSAGEIPNSLLKNLGNMEFEDVTESSGILSFHPTQTAAWLDYNNDGRIDLFIGNESTEGSVQPCELFRNNGDGTFTECAAEAGVRVERFVKGVAAADYDNDGRVDLYLSVRDGPNILLHNEGTGGTNSAPGAVWRFSDVTAKAGVAEPKFSFPTWFFDYNNDGWADLFVSGYFIRNAGDIAADYLGIENQGEKARLYRNNRNGTFTDVTREAGLYRVLHTMGCNFGDLDDDGFLDFYLSTGDPDIGTIIPNRMFWNNAGKGFKDVTSAGGFGQLQKGHAVAFADLDNDGDEDVYASIGGAYEGDRFRNVLFENPGTTNRSITLKLEGVQSNRSAIGARIRITASGPEGRRFIFKTVGSGGSFGANPLRQHIGVGTAAVVDLDVLWPASGKRQQFRGVKTGAAYRIVEGGETLTPMELRKAPFQKQAAGAHHHHHHPSPGSPPK